MGTATDPGAAAIPDSVEFAQRAPDRKPGSRSLEIDRAKGLGIALVVWGHIPSMSTPGLPLWLYVSVSVIYYFHMPLFMYLSGFVFFMSGGQDRFWRGPAKQIMKRFDRLMLPCLAFAVLIVAGKYFAASFGPVDDRVDAVGDALVKIVTNAPGNPAISLWYLIVLFVYVIAAPVLWRLGRGSFVPILLIGAIGWLLPLPEDYYLERIGQYFIFFAIGGIIAKNRDMVYPILVRWFAPALLVFGALCYLMLGHPLALLVCGLASIPALHGLFLQRLWDGDRLLLGLGRNSMAIYLMNTIIIGITKIAYLRYFSYHGPWVALFLAVVFVGGLLGPILIRRVLGLIPQTRPIRAYLD